MFFQCVCTLELTCLSDSPNHCLLCASVIHGKNHEGSYRGGCCLWVVTGEGGVCG